MSSESTANPDLSDAASGALQKSGKGDNEPRPPGEAPQVAIAPAFQSLYVITWTALSEEFGGTLQDHDIVRMAGASSSPGSAMITLEAGPGITWWKDVEIYDSGGTLRALAWTQDNHRSGTLSVPSALVPDCFMVLSKAKFLGTHQHMYVLPAISNLIDTHATLRWLRDS